MKIKQLPMDPGPAAWNSILPKVPERASLNIKRCADWLIVGAGFSGLSAARRLSELHPGDEIVVLDAERVAEGPAGRNSGFMIDVPHVLTSEDYGVDATENRHLREIRLNRAGIAYAMDAKVGYAMPDEAITLSGKINGAITPRGIAHNRSFAKFLQALGEPFKVLDSRAMKTLTGTDRYIDGLYTPGSAMLQPAIYIRELSAGIESSGVSIYEQSPVVELKREGANWLAITPSGSVSANKVILCVNGHLESFGFYRRKLIHIYTYGSMTRQLTQTEISRLGGERTWALTPADALGTTVRRVSGTGGDRIVVRNRATYDPSLRVDSQRLHRIANDHDRSFTDRFPMLEAVDMEFRWGGRLCLSLNDVSAFGEIESGLYSACCQNGLGTAKGTISGKLIAELASDQRSSLLDDQLAEPSPKSLPPEPLATIGANVRLRWGEWRAGREL